VLRANKKTKGKNVFFWILIYVFKLKSGQNWSKLIDCTVQTLNSTTAKRLSNRALLLFKSESTYRHKNQPIFCHVDGRGGKKKQKPKTNLNQFLTTKNAKELSPRQNILASSDHLLLKFISTYGY
jgi:hypothetical protein